MLAAGSFLRNAPPWTRPRSPWATSRRLRVSTGPLWCERSSSPPSTISGAFGSAWSAAQTEFGSWSSASRWS
eukprot:11705837-Alexandrium_andersonii.AAC.1